MIGLFFWSPWEEPTEVEWLATYETWSDGTDAALEGGLDLVRARCEASFDEDVGNPSSERLQPVADVARRGCAAGSPDGFRDAQLDVVGQLMAVHGETAPPRQRRDYARIASRSVGVEPDVYCWQPAAWPPFLEHYAIVRGGEQASLKSVLDPAASRIDLEPAMCAALGRYLQRIKPSEVTYQNYELAESLIVLTHEAEHLKAPTASEAAVECFALQHVRPLVREAGWGEAFANEIALLAWEIYYPRVPPQFRTRACRDGGRLDRNPDSNAWP